jgi:hypothetical protein
MGLITKEVEIQLCSSNIKWYENKGYILPKHKDRLNNMTVPKGSKIFVKCKDLKAGSRVKIDVKCDHCSREYPIEWNSYSRYVKEDGNYYCNKCNSILYGNENMRLAKLNKYGSLSKTDPEFIKYFVNKEEANNYSRSSKYKPLLHCPICGTERNDISIDVLTRFGFSCYQCSDGISYPNKFGFSLFKQLDINFISEYSPIWTKIDNKKSKRYDLYFELNNNKYIVEMDGLWHSVDNKMSGMTYLKSKSIDDEKDRLSNTIELQACL